MRKLSISMLLLALGSVSSPVSISAFAASSQPSSPVKGCVSFSSFTGEIKGDRVRMRLAPHIDSTIIKELSKGDLVAVVGENKEYYIITAPQGLKGYVFRTFVLDNVIEGEQVNVRLEPSTSSPVLIRLTRGTTVHATSEQSHGKWLEISIPDQCLFYVAKNFISQKGPIELYQRLEGQKKIALDMLNSAMDFATVELKKDLKDIDLESIYRKINQLQSDEFADIPGLSAMIRSALEKVQDAYLTKSIEKQGSGDSLTSESSTASTLLLPTESSSTTSLLSQHIRKQTLLNTKPLSQGRESFELSLFKIWANMHPQDVAHTLTLEDFYREESKHKQVFTGILEVYPHIVKNHPGDYLLRDQEKVLTFLYATHLKLEDWVGKKVTVEAVSRPNNHFAFPAHFVLSIKEAL